MEGLVDIANGFVGIGAGLWLVGSCQPAAFEGSCARRRRKGWRVPDRGALDLVELDAPARCATATRPFLTLIPCAAPISAVSDKILVAPAAAREGAELVRLIPFSIKGSFCVTRFAGPSPDEDEGQEPQDAAEPPNHQTTKPPNPAWVVMATVSRTARVPVADGATLSVRPESVVAWTGPRPSGFCPRLGLGDILLPRGPKNLLLRFHGPCLVWVEGSGKRAEMPANPFARRAV